MVGVDSVKDGSDEGLRDVKEEDTASNAPPRQATKIFDIPLSNVERLRSTYPRPGLLRYTEFEGRRLFEELDRDGDGQVTLEDLEAAMRNRKLPQRYARDLMCRIRSHLFCKSFGWKQFLSFMEQKEPTILWAYTSLRPSKSGTLQKSEVLASLKNAGLPANEDNVVAMMRFLNADTDESISYGHFRNLMLLLPSDRLQDDPRNIWFEAATIVAVPPAVNIPAGSVLKSALAGGLASALSTSFFHGLRTGICEASRLLLISIAPSLPELQVQSVSSFCGTFCEVMKQRLQAGIFDNVGEAILSLSNSDEVQASIMSDLHITTARTILYGIVLKIWKLSLIICVPSAVEAECRAMRLGMEMAADLKLEKVTLLSDSTELIWALNMGSWRDGIGAVDKGA
ncbi:hypothetical protein QQ045_003952 [Rhodiola kirilowii]